MTTPAAAQPSTAGRVRSLVVAPAAAWVGAVVGIAFVARLLLAYLQSTPVLFPDEYIYSSLSRSIAASGLPEIRGAAAHFPALLAPLLTAPAWLVDDVATAYRLAQAIGALAVSLTAVPVYLLARRVGVGQSAALASAVLALLVPDTVYAGYLTAESFAYPLAIAAVYAGVGALERPSRGRQTAFVVLAALTTMARVQFVVLAAAFVVAAVMLGLRERALRRVLREQSLPLALFGALGIGFAVLGLGYYGNVVNLSVVGRSVFLSAGTNVLVLLFVAGIAIVPGAVIGLWSGLVRPESRAELAFAALTTALALALVEEAAVYGTSVHERYLFYLAPVFAVAFARYAQRGWPRRGAHALLALLIVVGATRVPLTELGSRGEANSALLVAVHWLRIHTGTPGDAALVALGFATVAALAAAAASVRPRVGAAVVFAVSGVVAGSALAGVTAFNHRNAVSIAHRYLASDPSWVDHFGVGSATLVQAAGGHSGRAHIDLFWNRSVDRVLLAPGAAKLDEFAATRLRVGDDGTLLAGSSAVHGPLLLDSYGSLLRLRGERELGRDSAYRLVAFDGPARLALAYRGFFGGRWVAPRATVQLWAAPGEMLNGTLRLPLWLPRSAESAMATLSLPDETRRVTLEPGRPTVVELSVCAAKSFRVSLRIQSLIVVGERFAGAGAGDPTLVPSRACARSGVDA